MDQDNIVYQPQGEGLTTQGRKIIIFLSQEGKKKVHQSNAMTWGELQSELSDMDFRKKDVVIQKTRNSLSVDSAELPQGDFTLFAYPKESKSGADSAYDFDYNRIRIIANYLNKRYNAKIIISQKRENIQCDVDDYVSANNLDINAMAREAEASRKTKTSKVIKQSTKKETSSPITKNKSIKEKLAQVETAKVVKGAKEESKKESGSKPSTNLLFPSRMDIHIHVAGISEIADVLKLNTLLKAANTEKPEGISEIALKLAKSMISSIEISEKQKEEEPIKLLEIVRLKKEADEKEALDLKIKEERKVQARKDREEEVALANEARDIGRQLKH